MPTKSEMRRIRAQMQLNDKEKLLPVTGPDAHGSVYVYFQPEKRGKTGIVGRTVEHVGMVNIDYDAEGNLFGIELLNVDKR